MNPFIKDVATTRHTTLNPIAAEFVPLALRSASGCANNSDIVKSETTENCGKAVLERTDSAASVTSDDEIRQYWRSRLPDDITPDFEFFGEEDMQNSEPFVLQSPAAIDHACIVENVMGNEQEVYIKRQQQGFCHGINSSCASNGFPGFAAENLADNYYAKSGDISSAIDMLTQLELQDNIGLQQSVRSKSLYSSPNLSMMDFPAIPSLEMRTGFSDHIGDEGQQVNMYRSREEDKLIFGRPNVSGDSTTATEFAAVVRSPSQNSFQWKYNRNGPMELSIGPSQNFSISESPFAGNGIMINGDRLHGYAASQHSQLWLESGEAMDTHSDLRLEAQGHTYFQNAYFEQARQAYLVGNKDLTKELRAKGQWYNGQMKAAYGRTGEAIFGQRNPQTTYLQNFVQGQDRLIDLHGLHVNEAINVLKHELNVLRNTARSTCQCQQVLICVGTGYHLKGSLIPARVSFAVERYLLEGEHLDYTEPQPGILQVVIY